MMAVLSRLEVIKMRTWTFVDSGESGLCKSSHIPWNPALIHNSNHVIESNVPNSEVERENTLWRAGHGQEEISFEFQPFLAWVSLQGPLLGPIWNAAYSKSSFIITAFQQDEGGKRFRCARTTPLRWAGHEKKGERTKPNKPLH